jgi:hypothetical protein
MPERIVDGRLDDFVAALKESGGSSGNRALRQRLAWEEEFYWKVQGRLIEKGIIAPGRGMGGSVHLTDRLEGSEGDHEPETQHESNRSHPPAFQAARFAGIMGSVRLARAAAMRLQA